MAMMAALGSIVLLMLAMPNGLVADGGAVAGGCFN
jgi:hypothetical protein